MSSLLCVWLCPVVTSSLLCTVMSSLVWLCLVYCEWLCLVYCEWLCLVHCVWLCLVYVCVSVCPVNSVFGLEAGAPHIHQPEHAEILCKLGKFASSTGISKKPRIGIIKTSCCELQ